MFRKLQIKLTLINLFLSLIAILTILISIFVLMKSTLESDIKSQLVFFSKTERIFPQLNTKKRPLIFLVKLNSKNEFIDISTNLINNFNIQRNQNPQSIEEQKVIEEIKNITTLALKTNKSNGNIDYQDLELKFIVKNKSFGKILFFIDNSHNIELLKRLIIILSITGAISLFFIALLSLYLAQKAIIPIKNSYLKQKEFIADASHELRTPLTVITTNLDVVLDNQDESFSSNIKWLNNIKSETERMTKLVTDLLFLARSDSNENILELSTFNLSEAIILVLSPFEAIANSSQINIKQNIQSDIFFNGNETKIRQLIAILVDNALKHTHENGKIEILLSLHNNNIKIQIKDTGEGISPEHIEKIFERFYRIDKSRARNLGGSGLGLSIASCIVKEHKGNISVQSEINKGSTFTITLPYESNKIKH